jgi:hypothetical protein
MSSEEVKITKVIHSETFQVVEKPQAQGKHVEEDTCMQC